jgi:GNAT superfamily N-acetyltransferase
MKYEFKTLIGSELTPYLEELARLRITVFKEFPYIYEGSLDYEKEYLSSYQNSQQALVILVFDQSKVIGATTGIPMNEETSEFYQVFLDRGLDIEKVFYFGESIILPKYRGNKIGHQFFELREQYAHQVIPSLQYTAFCAVERESSHPLRPSDYRPLDQFWARMGYQQQEGMQVFYPWKDLDKDQEDEKAMNVWLKKW